jgi:hypothetical protein
MSTQEFESLTNMILTAGQDLLDRSQTGAVFLPLDEVNYVAVGTLAGILHVAGKEFPADASTAGATQGGITSLEGLTRYRDLGGFGVTASDAGPYVRFEDVESLLASTAVEQKEPAAIIKATQEYLVDVVRSFGDVNCAAYISTWHKPEVIAAAIGASQAAPASPEHAHAIPAGWKMVPVEPTYDMLINADAKVGNVSWDHSQSIITDDEARTVWKQMIDAAPIAAAPAAPEQDEVRNQALEDAALAAEKVRDEYSERQSGKWPELRDDAETGAAACVDAIRSMKRQPISEGEKGGASDE